MSKNKEELNKQLLELADQLGDLVSSNLIEDVTFEKEELFTVILSFSDHTDGLAQYKADSPRKALEMFIADSEALREYDRNMVKIALKGLWKVSTLKGVWGIFFTPLAPGLEDSEGNSILGGFVITSDSTEAVRE